MMRREFVEVLRGVKSSPLVCTISRLLRMVLIFLGSVLGGLMCLPKIAFFIWTTYLSLENFEVG